MSNRVELLTPVGRLVQGSLYEPQTTDAENRPLTVKTGVNAGQHRVEFYFALAIAKGRETHWNQTEWGAKIWQTGQIGFPNGAANSPAFAWKIKDGDDTTMNKVGRRPCDREGYPGHWVLNFASGFAPTIYSEDGTKQIPEVDFVKLGDYIQVYGSVADNGAIQQPGVYLNHSVVAFSRYGERIHTGVDPKAVGFGKSPIPSGALNTPPDGRFNPSAPPLQPVAPPVAPYTPILTPPAPVPVAPVRVMTAAAQASYEQYIAAGWTDAQLIQHGMMQA
jgi:hypothetical protein